MARGLAKAFNIESGEGASVYMMIFQSVFLGVFYGTFDISASAMFLEVFEASMIPKAFLVSGVVGIIMTSLYSWLQSKIRFSVFAVINLFLAVALTVLMRFGFTLTDDNYHIFVVFVMMGPINIIALLGFWGTVGRMFTLRQGKRLFGLIDTGQIIGIILSSFAIPVLLSYEFATRDLLYISAVGIAVALLVQVIISSRFRLDQKAEAEAQAEEAKGAGFFAMFRNRYIGLMSLFFALLIAVSIIVHFIFYAVVKENYPDPVGLAAFLGFFNGSLMIFTILVKTVVYGWLMKTWGLKVSLAISPILIVIFCIVAAVIGSLFGYTALAAGFTFFFLIISVSKLFAKSLQDSIVAPSMKLLYQSLDAIIRYKVQARIDGTINEVAVLLSSLALAGLGAISFFGLIHIVYFLIAILVAWGFVSFRLYNAYQNSLNQSLAKYRQSGEGTGQVSLRTILEGALGHDSEPDVSSALGFMERIDFSGFLNALRNLLESTSRKIRGLSLKRIMDLHIPVAGTSLQERVEKENAGENKEIATQILDPISRAGKARISKDDLLLQAKSANPDERLIAGLYLLGMEGFDHHAVLNTLMRDPEPAVKNVAIQVARKWKVTDTVPVLIDFLSTQYYRQAFEALVEIGEKAVELLEQSYYKSGVSQQTMNRVTRILGEIGEEQATKSLVNKINYQNREVESYALRALRRMDYRADEKVLPSILDGIRKSVQQIAWFLAAEYTISENSMGDPIRSAIGEELENARDHLYLLLSLAYDPSSVHHIRQNLESGTSEGIGFAIELLDLFVADEVKPVLFPVLDDTSTVEKIRQLQVEFPIVFLEPYELLVGIINRDPNLVNPVTKASAIFMLDTLPDVTATGDLIAQIFNPDDLLNELAALQTGRLDPDLFGRVMDRLAPEKKNHLNRICRKEGERKELFLWDIIKFLKEDPMFGDLSSGLQYMIANHSAHMVLSEGQEIDLSSITDGTGLALVREGNASLVSDDRQQARLSAHDTAGILPFLSAEKNVVIIRAETGCVLYTLTQGSVDELIFDYEEMAMVMYRWVREQQDREGKQTKAMVS